MFLRQTSQIYLATVNNLKKQMVLTYDLFVVKSESELSDQLFPERWFDLVLVLRCNNTLLWDRLQARGYKGKKLEENLQAEIFQTILDEAKESYRLTKKMSKRVEFFIYISTRPTGHFLDQVVREELVVELPSEKEEDLESNAGRVRDWIVQWREDRNSVRPTKRKATGDLEN